MSDTRPYTTDSGTEPALRDLLSDQTLLLLLRRDGLSIEQLTAVIDRWRADRFPESDVRVAAE